MALPTLDDLKAHLNIPAAGTADDPELTDMLDAAADVVSGIVGPLEPTEVTETHHSGWGVIALRRSPVASVTQVSTQFGGVIAPTDYELDSEAGLLYPTRGAAIWAPVTVTYMAGRSVLPAAISLAILIVAAHLFETQRMPGQSLDSRPAGFGGADGIPDAIPVRGFAIPNRALELLQSYTRPAAVA